MPIQTETIITEKIDADLWKYNLLKKPTGLFLNCIIILIAVVAVVLGILFRPYAPYESNSMIGIAVVLILIMYLFIFRLPHLLYQRNVTNLQKRRHIFAFEQEYFTAHTGENGEEGFSKIKYSSLIRVIETKDYFMIYVTRMQLFVICKDKISNASPLELRQLFQSVLTLKQFIIRR